MNIFEQLKRDEGVRPSVYGDSLGYLTIGVGFLVDDRKGGRLEPEEIDFILRTRVTKLWKQLLAQIPWYEGLDDARQGALENMAYNLGVGGLLDFKRMLDALAKGDWETAAREMLDSKWAQQVGPRAQRLAEQIKTGTWQ